ELLRDVFGSLIEGKSAPPEARLRGAALHLGQLLQLPLEARTQPIRVRPGELHEGTADPLLLVQNGYEQVLRQDLRVALTNGEPEGGLQGFLALGGEAVDLHDEKSLLNVPTNLSRAPHQSTPARSPSPPERLPLERLPPVEPTRARRPQSGVASRSRPRSPP